MITKLNEKALLQASEKAFRTAVIRKLNQIADAVSVGVVWDNKIKTENELLELSATMVELEYERLMEVIENV